MLTSLRSISLIILAFVIGGWCLFNNPSLHAVFDSLPTRIEWYGVFAHKIFHSHQTYISESILLPLIAKVLGAGVSSASWLVLCAIVMCLVLPVLTVVALLRTGSAARSLVFLLIVTLALNLQELPLGFPDPMTIGILGITAMQTRTVPLILGSFLAATSHFSLSLFSLIGLAVVMYGDSNSGLQKCARLKQIYALILGICSGKIFVSVWHLLLNYHAESRFEWMLQYGLQEFWIRYLNDPWAFWLTPGICFLIVYGLVLIFLVVTANSRLAVASFIALCIGYAANYLALDGLRIFVTAIAAPFSYVALRLASLIRIPCSLSTNAYYSGDSYSYQMLWNLHKLSFAFLMSAVWLYLMSAAQWAGYAINLMSDIRGFSSLIYWFYFVLATILFAIATNASRVNDWVMRAIKMIYIGLLMLVVVQGTRSWIYPEVSVASWIKLFLLCFIGFVSYYIGLLATYQNVLRLFYGISQRISSVLQRI